MYYAYENIVCKWVKRHNKFGWVVGALLIQYFVSLQMCPVSGQRHI